MRRIIVREARPGMRAARAVDHPRHPGQPAVALGAELTIPHIITLHELGIYDLWVEEPDLEGFTDLIAATLSPAQQRLGEAILKSFRTLTANGAGAQRSLIKRHRLVLEELMLVLIKTAPIIPAFNALACQNPDLLQHSTDVCVLATLLGLQLESYLIDQRRRLNCRQARDVVNLAMGCLLHDMGELVMPPGQRESHANLTPGSLTAADEWRQHTGEGFAAVRKYVDATAAAIVLHHHQHFDGTGFAIADSRDLRQRGHGIHVFSRIAMAADVFQHVLVPAGASIPIVNALWQIQQPPLRGWFDPIILETLIAMMPPFVPGVVVTLRDRRQAVITRTQPETPFCPEVQVLRSDLSDENATGEVLDLDIAKGIQIAGIEGTDVTQCLNAPSIGRPLAAA